MNSDNGAGYTDSYVAYPDEVLTGTLYRLPTLPAAGGKVIKYRLFYLSEFLSPDVSRRGL